MGEEERRGEGKKKVKEKEERE